MLDDGGRFISRSAVFVALRNEKGEVLLHRRANTGYMDGRYDLPSGHVEPNETILDACVRELKEEAGIDAKTADLRLWHINQFGANNEYYYNFFFTVDTWEGIPTIMEPDKCDDMRFFAADKLPKMAPATHVALNDIDASKVTVGYVDQATFDTLAA